MLFSTNLLKQYISLDIIPKDLMSMMTLHACEVEHVAVRKIPDLVVIGYVTEVVKHPDADTLVICQLDCGSHGHYQICTAADNVRSEIFVPVALPGSYLPAIDLTIGSRKMRGQESNGMICAKVELGIDEDVDLHGIWIIQDDDPSLTKDHIGQSLSVVYPWLENTILDVDNKTINNRPDLTGLLGMAIEMKAIFTRSEKIKHQNITHILDEHHPARTLELLAHASSPTQSFEVTTDKCSIYSLLEIDAITVRQSPFYDRLSLIDSGLSSKNNWVDFSNLFMTLTGQPIHIFDADKIQGQIIVRQAKDGEKMTDLTGSDHILSEQDIVIADDSGVIALAGVIGGLSTAVSDSTQRIVIEIAHFDPVVVRRTSMRIGVRTDAVMRFEKTISPLLSLTSLSLILDILKQYKPLLGDYAIVGMYSEMNDQVRSYATSGQWISFDLSKCIQMIFGRDVQQGDQEMVNGILNLLGFQVEKRNVNGLLSSPRVKGDSSLRSEGGQVKIPRRRGADDMNISEDLYEEVVRLYGYNRIDSVVSHESVTYTPFVGLIQLNRIAESILVQRYKADQLQTYPRCDEMFFDILSRPLGKGGLGGFADRSHLVQLRNATAPELSYLRPSIIPNLLLAVQKNSKIYSEFTLFDSGQTRNKSEQYGTYLDKQPYETTKLAIVRYQKNPSDWTQDALLLVKSMIEDVISAMGLQGTISYASTDHPSYHPKKQGEIVFVSSLSSGVEGNEVERSFINKTIKDTARVLPSGHPSTRPGGQKIVIGTIAQLHPTTLNALKIDEQAQVVCAELALEAIDDIFSQQESAFQSAATYHTIQDQILTRDLAFVVDQTQDIGQIIDIVRQIAGVSHVNLFDLYQGSHLPAGKKSLALTLTIVGDGAWTTDQINAVMDSAIAAVEKIGGKLR